MTDNWGGAADRLLTHTARHQRNMARWLDELDEFYDLLILHRVPLVELGLLTDFQNRAKRMLRIAVDESEVGASMVEEFEAMINSRLKYEPQSV